MELSAWPLVVHSLAAMLNQDVKNDGSMPAAWMAYSTPGAAQAQLATRVGTWDLKLKHWSAPGAPPVLSEGTSTFTMKYRGRFLFQNFKSTWEGNLFECFGITGYKNKMKEVQFTWLDSLSTGLMQGSSQLIGSKYK
jgi:hypothetical protein